MLVSFSSVSLNNLLILVWFADWCAIPWTKNTLLLFVKKSGLRVDVLPPGLKTLSISFVNGIK